MHFNTPLTTLALLASAASATPFWPPPPPPHGTTHTVTVTAATKTVTSTKTITSTGAASTTYSFIVSHHTSISSPKLQQLIHLSARQSPLHHISRSKAFLPARGPLASIRNSRLRPFPTSSIPLHHHRHYYCDTNLHPHHHHNRHRLRRPRHRISLPLLQLLHPLRHRLLLFCDQRHCKQSLPALDPTGRRCSGLLQYVSFRSGKLRAGVVVLL